MFIFRKYFRIKTSPLFPWAQFVILLSNSRTHPSLFFPMSIFKFEHLWTMREGSRVGYSCSGQWWDINFLRRWLKLLTLLYNSFRTVMYYSAHSSSWFSLYSILRIIFGIFALWLVSLVNFIYTIPLFRLFFCAEPKWCEKRRSWPK